MSNDRKQRAEQMRKEREKAEKRQRNVITIAIVAVVVALVGVGAYAINATSKENAKATDVVQPKNTTDDFGIVFDQATAGGDAADGAAADGEDAAAAGDPVPVELYEDFQCPACRSFEQQANAFIKQQVASGAIEVTYRPFSFLDEAGGSPNDYSKRSTNVALCALDAGGVEDYVTVHDYLYANQPEEGTPGPENNELIEAVDGLGLTGLDSCIKTEKFVPWVKEAYEAGQKNDVSGTPTIFVAGEKLENTSPQSLQAAITAAQES